MTAATEHLHWVKITGDARHPQIEFTCHGDRDAECHSYPHCECETWIRGEHEHEFVPHDTCWMKSFFDNADDGGISPAPELLEEEGITVGMSGPIVTHFEEVFIEWEFIEQAAEQRAQAAQQFPMFAADGAS